MPAATSGLGVLAHPSPQDNALGLVFIFPDPKTSATGAHLLRLAWSLTQLRALLNLLFRPPCPPSPYVSLGDNSQQPCLLWLPAQPSHCLFPFLHHLLFGHFSCMRELLLECLLPGCYLEHCCPSFQVRLKCYILWKPSLTLEALPLLDCRCSFCLFPPLQQPEKRASHWIRSSLRTGTVAILVFLPPNSSLAHRRYHTWMEGRKLWPSSSSPPPMTWLELGDAGGGAGEQSRK